MMATKTMEKRGRGRPIEIPPKVVSHLKQYFDDGETSARTIRDRFYVMNIMTKVPNEIGLAVGMPETAVELNKRWPFTFPPLGKRPHYSLLIEIGRWEEEGHNVIGVLDGLEREANKGPFKIKDAIQWLRTVRWQNKS